MGSCQINCTVNKIWMIRNKMLQSIKTGNYKPSVLFLLKLGLLTLPVIVFFSFLRSKPGIQLFVSESFPVYHLGKLIMTSAHKVLSIAGYQSTLLFDRTIYHYGVFSLQITGGVRTFIGFSCLGLGVTWVFIAMIISLQGKALRKIIYIIIGSTLIFILNVARMSYLTWLGRNGKAFTDIYISFFGIGKINHHDLFNIFIYIIIFLLFILWTEVFSQKKVKY
jgi:exosortase/archaeosortase family protein